MERAHTVLLNPRQHIREGLQSRDAKAQFDLCYGADDLPGMFRIFMTAEARPGLSGALRRSFFREVICRAQELYEADVKALSREEAESSEILSVAHSPLSRASIFHCPCSRMRRHSTSQIRIGSYTARTGMEPHLLLNIAPSPHNF
ncbi:hypothetical protein L227DRAFT_124346 [Lentinus tigrinus ALCF2SS1-6]|uniref:Uncharacterized protein n=1 Tax=Lentinus tigrinus ALCF2SS1-6 TaxID=1328759 RepID=A0A5C2SR56_9APHY|nr:hypothetical protein L227DRAFT_124346 [Lentinus tigrinus ALCF2SS1-6]